jgi:hypothetical protein
MEFFFYISILTLLVSRGDDESFWADWLQASTEFNLLVISSETKFDFLRTE